MPTPWLCLQDDLRRAGVDPATLNRISGPSMADNAAALRAGALDAVQVFQPYAEELIASGAGHVWYAAADRGLTAYTTLVTRRPLLQSRRDELLRMTRAIARTLRWIAATPGTEIARALADFFPSVAPDIFAAAIDRYRALGCSLPTRCCGARASTGCRRPCGPAARSTATSRSSDCVDNSLAEQALADARPGRDKNFLQHPPQRECDREDIDESPADADRAWRRGAGRRTRARRGEAALDEPATARQARARRPRSRRCRASRS